MYNKNNHHKTLSFILYSVIVSIIINLFFKYQEFNTLSDIFSLFDYKFYLLSIFIYSALYFFSKPYKIKIIELENDIKSKELLCESNKTFVKNINNKGYEIKFDFSNNNPLGKALLQMKHDVLSAKQKEEERLMVSRGRELISNILMKHSNINEMSYEVLTNIIKYINVNQGAFYIYNEEENVLRNIETYAYNRKRFLNQSFKIGHGLIGQAAYELDIIYLTDLPDYYCSMTSGLLGEKKPSSLLIVPLISDKKLQGIIELASVEDSIPENSIKLVKQVSEMIAQTIFTLKVNEKTSQLLEESRLKTEELCQNEILLKQSATEMEEAHEKLEETNQKLESKIKEVENSQKRTYTILENASEVISIIDKNEIVTFESPSVKNVLGYDADEIIGKNAFERIDPSYRDKLYSTFDFLIKNPDGQQIFEFQYIKKDEDIVWLESKGRNCIENPAINGIVFNTRDITQQKIAEREQRMRGQMQSLSENSPDIIIRFGIDGKVFYVNPMMQYFTEIKTKNFLKKSLEELDLEQQIKIFFKNTIEHIKLKKKKHDAEFVFPTIHGTKIMQVNAIPEFNEENQLESILFVAHDVTERKQIEIEIQEKNKKITESINYAEHIQVSILPNTKLLQEYIEKSFIYYYPKDVVSGDFPWFFKKDDLIYIAVVDCTGHGVPGAMLSLIGYFLLNNIVDHDIELKTSEILDELNIRVRHTLRQESPEAEARDGMDIALLKINLSNNTLEFAGAHRPLLFLRNSELTEIKSDKKAIGGIPLKGKVEAPFVNHVIKINSGDKFFIYSDGLTDQLGGTERKKYSSRRVRELISNNHNFSISEFSVLFANDYSQWMGKEKQIDDVLLIGLEICHF
ncbi:MAG: hypothetical protein A2046_11675 [Bacteroidetes bacterium GWA2_30_7]|nr:MAG: hypothetical protein A2046_11675 [Bacteroidetes bacterium GWA2_30_7]